jgi:hypothetical protein
MAMEQLGLPFGEVARRGLLAACHVGGHVATDNQKRHDDREQHPEQRGSVGLPAAELAPALGETSVGNPTQRKVGQVATEIGGQRGGVGVAVARFMGQALAENGFQPAGDVRVDCRKALAAQPAARLGRGPREASPECVPEEPAERVNIRAAVDDNRGPMAGAERGQGRGLLRRHISGCSSNPGRCGVGGEDRRPRQVEVEQEGLAVGGQQDV